MITVVRENWLTRPLSSEDTVKSLLCSMLLILGCFLYWNQPLGLDRWMSADGTSVFEKHQLWRLWTTLFAHADFHHLLSNAFLFFILGIFLIGYFGSWVFPLMAILFGGITNAIVLQNMLPTQSLIGMSGVVYWMGGFWLTLYLMIDTRRTLSQRLLRSFGVALGIFMPMEAFSAHISYASHAVGFLLGILFGFIYFFFHRKDLKNAEVREIIWDEPEDLPTATDVQH